MNEIKILRDRIKTTFFGDSEFAFLHPGHGPSILKRIENLSLEQVITKPHNYEHSISEITYHVTNWVEATLMTLREGRMVEPSEISSWPNSSINNEAEWVKIINSLERAVNTLLDELLNWDKSKLYRNIPGTDTNYIDTLKGAHRHMLFHVDQLNAILEANK